MKKLLILIGWALSCAVALAQIPPNAPTPLNSTLTNLNLPQAGVGTFTPSNWLKQRLTDPTVAWMPPIDLTYSSQTSSPTPSEVFTQTGTSAKGYFVYDGGSSNKHVYLRWISGTFNSTGSITGGTSGDVYTVTALASNSYKPLLWAGYLNNTGVLAMDGEGGNRRGGATIGASFTTNPMLFGTGSGLYAATIGTLVQKPYTAKNGAFTLGEVMTEATTGAVGRLVKDSGTVLTIMATASSAAWDTTHTYNVTGSTSGHATTTVTASTVTATTCFLEWSVDGFSAFTPVVALPNTAQGSILVPDQIVDCGIITKSTLGTSNTRLLLVGDYSEGGPGLYACQPDVNPYTWTTLFSGDGSGTGSWPGSTQSVRHYHGLKFIPGLGANDGRLFAYLGDADFQCSILVSDDVSDMVTNASNWKVNWGFNICGPARAFWFANTATKTDVVPVTASGLTKGEKVTQGSAVGYVQSDTAGSLTILRATGSVAFASSGAITGATSAATDTPSGGAVTTTTTGGGANYACGTNPYPLSATATITGGQGVGGQDCRTVAFVVDNHVRATVPSISGTFTQGEEVIQTTTGALGTIGHVDTTNNVLYIIPVQSSPAAFAASYAITGEQSHASATPSKVGVGEYAYFIPDQSGSSRSVDTLPASDGYACPNGANHLRQVSLTTLAIQTGAQRAIGTGWAGCVTTDGQVILSTESDHTASSGTAYAGNNDAYCRLWAVGPDGLSVYPIAKQQRADFASPGNQAVFYGNVLSFASNICAWDYSGNLQGGSLFGTYANKPVITLDADTLLGARTIQPPLDNWVVDSNFGDQVNTSGMFWFNTGTTNSTVIDTTTIDTQYGSVASLKTHGNGSSGSASTKFYLSQRQVWALRGKMVVFKCRVLAPTSITGSTPAIQVQDETQGDLRQTAVSLSDSWQTVYTKPLLVSTSCSSLSVALISRLSGTDQTYVYFSKPTLTEGTNPPFGFPASTNWRVMSPDSQWGEISVAYSANPQTLTLIATQYKTLDFTGSPGGTWTVNMGAVTASGGVYKGQRWTIYNNTGDGSSITVKVTGLTGVTIASGKRAIVECNGTDIVRVTPDQ